MTAIDQTELRELRERAQGAAADKQVVADQLRDALATIRELETALQQVTHHRNRLLDEKAAVWDRVLSVGDPEC